MSAVQIVFASLNLNIQMNDLSNEEISRYSRQLLVNNFGVEGQCSLKRSKVLIVGAGGLGCPVATYLAGSGIGTLGIVDYDQVSTDNLHRQVSHKEANVGKLKTESLKEFVNGLNHLVEVVCHNVLLDSSNATDVFLPYDVIVDCSDNAATRYLINDACVLTKKILVSGSALRWEGQLTVYNWGPDGPCYRCIFPQPPSASLVTNCSEGGVLGPVVGIIGSMQAMEVIKILSGMNPSYSGKLFLFDGQCGRTRAVNLRPRSPDCAVCGKNPTVTKLIDYTVFCGAGPNDKIVSLKILSESDRISATELSKLIGQKATQISLIDTRPPNEFAICSIKEATNITLENIRKLDSSSIISQLPHLSSDNRQLFVICHRGNDSQLAVEIMKTKLPDYEIRDIIGGYESWALEVDYQFPKY